MNSDDLESSIVDSELTERVLQATTGWIRIGLDDEEDAIDQWWRDSLDDDYGRRESDPWFDEESDGLSSQLVGGCARLSEEATRLAPGFVTRTYRVELQPLEPQWWDLNDGRRLRVALVPHDAKASWKPLGFGLDSVGAGLRIWALFAVYEAIRRVSARTDRSTVFLFDEPERHLHPVAQREAASFIASIVAEGANVIVATHAPAFLNEPIPLACYVQLSRTDGVTRASPLDPGRLDDLSEEVGMDRSDILLLTRSFLIVEGTTDRKIIDHFYGDDLRRERVVIIPVHGTRRARALPEAELLHRLNKPVAILFDNMADSTSDERRVMEDIIARWPAEVEPPIPVEFGSVDILRALPDEPL